MDFKSPARGFRLLLTKDGYDFRTRRTGMVSQPDYNAVSYPLEHRGLGRRLLIHLRNSGKMFVSYSPSGKAKA